MKAWIIYHKQDAEYNKAYIQFYMEEGKKLDIEVELIYADELSFGIKDGNYYCQYQGISPMYPDFVICRTIYPHLTKQLESMNIPVFNNSKVATICNDKSMTYQYISQLAIPMVDTTFCKNEYLLQNMQTINEPTVIKAVSGHGGSQVFLLESAYDQFRINEIQEGMKGEDAVLQPLIGSRHQDLRVYVIGNQVIGAVLRTAKEGFKSNFSLGGQVEAYPLSSHELAIVHKIISLFEFGLVGIDFIIGDQGEFIFNEIEDVVGSRMLYQCTNINIVEKYLSFIKKKMTGES